MQPQTREDCATYTKIHNSANLDAAWFMGILFIVNNII